MRATIVFATARPEPRLDWLVDGLEAQAALDDHLELIVVDALGRRAVEIGFRPIACVSSLVETTPKPTPWQGAGRVTGCDWWAAANARNTGIALATSDYLAFLDDRSRPGPHWLAAVRDGERARASAVAGSYDRFLGAGDLDQDHRRLLCPEGRRDCGGGWLYGCTFALPLSFCLDVNGFEEGCDGDGGEDCVFGLMLANDGRRVDFDPRLFVLQDRTCGSEHGLSRAPRGVVPAGRPLEAIRRFGARARTELTPDLRALRADLAAGRGFPAVDPAAEHRDWYDERLLRES